MRANSLLAAMVVGVGLLVAPGVGLGQGPPRGAPPAELDRLAAALADRVRHLGEDIATEFRRDPAAPHLIEDTQELAQAVDEFRAALRTPGQAGTGFAGIDSTWQHLRGQLTRPGLGSDPVARAMNRVEEVMGPLRQGLGMNPPPPAYYGGGPAPAGVADVRRLAHALVGRAQGLAGAIQVGMVGNPSQGALLADAGQLVQLADGFHDAIDANQPPDVVAQAFTPVAAVADRIGQFAGSGQAPPGVQQAWQGVAAVEGLIRQNLGINTPGPAVPTVLIAPPGGGPPPLVGLAGQLVEQVNAYVATFATTARHEPEGLAALADAQRLLAAAAEYRQVAARGLPPNQLAYEFRDVDAHWQRLARRAARIARGRNGPYIQQVRAIGGTCEQIHQALGMIGSPPALGEFGPGVPPPPPPGSGPYR